MSILQNPIKVIMLIILLILEIPAAICLIVWWKRACKEAKSKEDIE